MRKGDIIEYFDSDNNKEGYSINPEDISVNEAYERLSRADVKYRFSIDMASLKSK